MGNLYQLIPNAFTIYSDAYAKIGEIGFDAVEASGDNSPKQPVLEDQLIHCASLFYELNNAIVLNDDGDAIVGLNIDASIVNALLLQLREAAGLNTLSAFPTPLTTLDFNTAINGNYQVGGLGAILQSNGITYLPFEMGNPGEVLTSTPAGLIWSAVVGNGIPSGGTTGQYLEKINNTSYNGQWATLTASKITDLTASAAELNILDGILITTTELNRLSGVTSPIQTQLNSKLSTSLDDGKFWIGNGLNVATAVVPSGVIAISNSGVFSFVNGSIINADVSSIAAITRTKLASGIAYRLVVNDATGAMSDNLVILGSRVLISDANGVPTSSGVTSTTLSFLDASSSIQTQLNTKLTVSLTSPAQGDMLYYNGTNWINFTVGTSGQVLTSNGTIPVWGSATANGLPSGGTTNQVLRKIDATNYNAQWHTLVLADITDVSTTSTELNLLSGLTVDSTVINYLSGANANIQTQIDGRLTNNLAFHAIWIGGAGNTAVQIAPGTEDSVLTIVSGHPTWQTPPPPGNVSGPVSSTDNALVRWNLTAGDSIQDSGIILDDSNNMLFPTGTAIRTATSAGNTLLLQAYDVDGTAYVTFATLTANNTPSFDINTGTTIGASYIYRIGGTDVSLADGGTGASLADPNADRILFWDDSAGQVTWLTVGTNLSITGTTINATGGGGGGSVNSVNGTTDRIDISGPATDPIVDIAATYAGQASIETLGVVSVGTWQADIIDYPYGGTGLFSLGSALQVLRVNAGATALEYATVSPGHIIEDNGSPLTQRDNLNIYNGLSAFDNTPDTDIVWGGRLTQDTDIGGASGSFNVVFGRFSGSPDQLNSFAVLATDSGVSGGILLQTNLSQGIFISGSTAGAGKIRLSADQVYVNSPFVLQGYATGALPTASSHSMGIAYDTTTNTVKFSNGSAWANIANTGTVTSVNVSGGVTGLTFSGGPITASGTITMAGVLDADNGGTGQSSYTVGDILYASTTTILSKLAAVAIGSYLRSAGTGTAPIWSTTTLPNSATTGDLLHASASNTYNNLAAVATGSYLRSAGIGTTPVWSTATLPNSATTGDLLYASASNVYSNLTAVASGSYLRSAGIGTAPVWSTILLPNAATTGDIWYASATSTISALAIGTANQFLGVNNAGTNIEYKTASNGLTPASGTLKWGGALTATTSITGAFAWDFTNNINGHKFDGTYTATANSQVHLLHTGTFTSRATVSDTFTGYSFTPSLTAGSTNQNLVAVRINPTWSTTNSPNNVGLWITVGNGDTGALPLYIETTAGARLYQFNAAGTLSVGSTGTASIGPQSSGSGSATGRGPLFGTTVSSSNSVGFMYAQNSTNITDATVNKKWIRSAAFTYNPTSGTTTLGIFEMSPTINQTSTATGAITLFDIIPTYTSVLGVITAFNYTPSATPSAAHYGIVMNAACFNSFNAGTTPSAFVHIGAGTATTAQTKYNSSTILTTAVAGVQEYNGSWYQTKASGLRFGIPGDIFDSKSTTGNGTTVETDLYTYTTPANTLGADNEKIIAEYGGQFVSSGTATRQIKIYFGGTAIFDTGALTLSLSSSWVAFVSIIRVSSSVIRYAISLATQGASSSSYTSVGELTGLTLSNTNILKITGQAAGVGAASNDITIMMATGGWSPASAN